VRTTYKGAVETLEEFLGLDLAHRLIQRVARDLTATVSGDPHDRRPVEEIADGLVNEGATTQRSKKTLRPKPHHKRIIASLTQDRSTVMNKAHKAARSRIHPDTVLRAVVADGEKNLWNFADELPPSFGPSILILFRFRSIYYEKISPFLSIECEK